MRAEQPQKMFNVAAKRVSIGAHENLTPLLLVFVRLLCTFVIHPLLIFFVPVQHSRISLIFLDVSIVLLCTMRMVGNCSGVS